MDSPSVCKLVLLGEMACGKTSLVHRYVKGSYYDNQESTIGASFFTKVVPEHNLKFELWDTAGQERYHSLAPMYYRSSSASVCVYDITNPESFQRAKKWVTELKSNVANPNLVIALVGNKVDLADDRKVEEAEARAYADEEGLLFFECSAKENIGVMDVFQAVAEKLAASPPSQRTRPQSSGIRLDGGAAGGVGVGAKAAIAFTGAGGTPGLIRQLIDFKIKFMRVPQAIESLTSSGTVASKRLKEIIAAAPEDGDVAQVVHLISEVLASENANGEKGVNKNAAQENVASPVAVDLSMAASVIDELFFLHPRGKQKLGFFGDRLVVKTAKQDIIIMASDVEDVVILDSIPKDTKNRVYIMLNFREDAGIKNGKTKMRACVIQVTSEQQLDIMNPKDATQRLSGYAAVVICQAIGMCGITGDKAAFHGSDAAVFRSCTNTAAVEAYVKARSGFLFPLKNGLCFLETPPIFIHKKKIRSVEFARANGTSATFDFQIHTKNGAIEEFSNISRHELGCIQNWVADSKLPVGFPEDETSDEEEAEKGDGKEVANSADEPSSNDDDSDFDPFVKKRAKKQRTEGGDADEGESSDEDDESSSDDDVELVDEDDMKVSALKKLLKDEQNDLEAAKAEVDPQKEDDSDASDEDFDAERDEPEESDSDSDGSVELVDEPGVLQVSDLALGEDNVAEGEGAAQ